MVPPDSIQNGGRPTHARHLPRSCHSLYIHTDIARYKYFRFNYVIIIIIIIIIICTILFVFINLRNFYITTL
jgi:hypothetical protein